MNSTYKIIKIAHIHEITYFLVMCCRHSCGCWGVCRGYLLAPARRQQSPVAVAAQEGRAQHRQEGGHRGESGAVGGGREGDVEVIID